MKGCILQSNFEDQLTLSLFIVLLILTWGLRYPQKRGSKKIEDVKIEDYGIFAGLYWGVYCLVFCFLDDKKNRLASESSIFFHPLTIEYF